MGYLYPLATVNSVSMNILSTNSENQFTVESTVSWFLVASLCVTSRLIDSPGFHPYLVFCVFVHNPSPPTCYKNAPSRTQLELSLVIYTYNPSNEEMEAGGPGGVQSPQSQVHTGLETSRVYMKLYLKLNKI